MGGENANGRGETVEVGEGGGAFQGERKIRVRWRIPLELEVRLL